MNRPIVKVSVVLAALLVLGGVSLHLPQVTAWD